MPVRSLTSSVMQWPRREQVIAAATAWAGGIIQIDPTILAVGYFGSYARNQAGVGSDLDLVVIVAASEERVELRSLRWDFATIPVPVDVLVYTLAEWHHLAIASNRMHRTLQSEAVWLVAEALAKPYLEREGEAV